MRTSAPPSAERMEQRAQQAARSNFKQEQRASGRFQVGTVSGGLHFSSRQGQLHDRSSFQYLRRLRNYIFKKISSAFDYTPGKKFPSYYPSRASLLHLVTTVSCPFAEQFREELGFAFTTTLLQTVEDSNQISLNPLLLWPSILFSSGPNIPSSLSPPSYATCMCFSPPHRSVLFKINNIISLLQRSKIATLGCRPVHFNDKMMAF